MHNKRARKDAWVHSPMFGLEFFMDHCSVGSPWQPWVQPPHTTSEANTKKEDRFCARGPFSGKSKHGFLMPFAVLAFLLPPILLTWLASTSGARLDVYKAHGSLSFLQYFIDVIHNTQPRRQDSPGLGTSGPYPSSRPTTRFLVKS